MTDFKPVKGPFHITCNTAFIHIDAVLAMQLYFQINHTNIEFFKNFIVYFIYKQLISYGIEILI